MQAIQKNLFYERLFIGIRDYPLSDFGTVCIIPNTRNRWLYSIRNWHDSVYFTGSRNNKKHVGEILNTLLRRDNTDYLTCTIENLTV
ncbi:hypothetical protein [Marinifilum fragile]|uniref:hypothetical protein n=1 Tax=Marinifilum fragile TaxID=570161 RepID=UPI00155D96CA|nr:hypothetical protein [Marinifilum fragile]